jgi:hypothetical protein
MGYLDPDADYGWHADNLPAPERDGIECHYHDCRRFISDKEPAVRFNGHWYCFDCGNVFVPHGMAICGPCGQSYRIGTRHGCAAKEPRRS